MNILNEIAEKTKERIAEEKRRVPREILLQKIQEQGNRSSESAAAPSGEKDTGAGQTCFGKTAEYAGHRFYRALKKPGMSYICEVKKASPSKGLIAPHFPYLDIAREYEKAGASAISCLTEPYYFQGSDQYLREITAAVNIPVLRKDFTIDEYMILQAAALGASAVLLICAILDDAQLKAYRELADELHLDSLVEAHDENEVQRALDAGAHIIGVNNRDLKTFKVDTGNSIRLRRLAPADVVFVSESGIRTAEDIRVLRENSVDAVLIGETLMRSLDKKKMLEELNGAPL